MRLTSARCMKPANSPLNDRLRANQNCKALRPQFGYKILAFERVKSCLLGTHEIGSGFVSTYSNNKFSFLFSWIFTKFSSLANY